LTRLLSGLRICQKGVRAESRGLAGAFRRKALAIAIALRRTLTGSGAVNGAQRSLRSKGVIESCIGTTACHPARRHPHFHINVNSR